MIQAVPTTIVTGFLGVGKTTAILDALARRPAGERWAVLVNEFGQVGLDGAILSSEGGVVVREIAGGCVCCTAGPQLGVAINRLLREHRPDRLLIEPTGLAAPASILDLLRTPSFRTAIALRAVITLVDAARFLRPNGLQDDVFLSQVEVADVLVANRADQTAPDLLDAFRAKAATLWPPKQVVAVTEHGRLDPAWLDLEPSPRARFSAAPPSSLVSTAPHAGPDVASEGWIFAPEVVFPGPATRRLLQQLVRPGPALPQGVLRLKAILHTDQGWWLVQATDRELTITPSMHRRDSRIEVLALVSSGLDLARVGAALASLPSP